MATRVYKYGLIPIGYPPQDAIDELRRANNLWNTLVALRPVHVTLSFERAYKLALWLKREPNLFPTETKE